MAKLNDLGSVSLLKPSASAPEGDITSSKKKSSKKYRTNNGNGMNISMGMRSYSAYTKHKNSIKHDGSMPSATHLTVVSSNASFIRDMESIDALHMQHASVANLRLDQLDILHGSDDEEMELSMHDSNSNSNDDDPNVDDIKVYVHNIYYIYIVNV